MSTLITRNVNKISNKKSTREALITNPAISQEENHIEMIEVNEIKWITSILLFL